MSSQPDAGTPTNASAAEVARLIPASRASFFFVRHGMRHEPADRQNNQGGGDLRNERHGGEQRNSALAKRHEAEKDQGRRRSDQSDQVPTTSRQSQIGDGSPKKSPQVGGEPDGDDGGRSGHRKSVLRQNKGQGDGSEPVTDAVGKNQEKERESRRRPRFTHEGTQS